MSTCISRHGEYSEHTLDDEFTCTLCGVLDEDALRAELRDLRARGAEHDQQVAERERERLALTALADSEAFPDPDVANYVARWLRDEDYPIRADGHVLTIARADSAAPARPTIPTPTVSEEWGVRCPLDGEVSEVVDGESASDAEVLRAHHDNGCGPGHIVVRREVTPWVAVTTDGGEE